jgi:soluble lytic murein transglycosylase
MMNFSWEPIILARWFSPLACRVCETGAPISGNGFSSLRRRTARALLFLTVFGSVHPAPPVNAATRHHRKAAAKKAVREAPKPKAAGAAALLALAQRELDQRNFQVASEYAQRAGKQAPTLDDYANYIRAEAELSLRNYAEVTKAVVHVIAHNPASPLDVAAAAVAVQADLDNDKPKSALELMRKYYDRIPQPQADFLLARSLQATGDLPHAAEYFQRVYYGYPKAQSASDSEGFLNDLKTRLGENYPPPMPAAMLGRAMKLADAGDYVGARNELNNVIPQLGGAQNEVARVRLGVVDFLNRNYAQAKSYLENLKVSDPEADAERLDYLVRSMLRIDKQANVESYLDILAAKYPQSRWRLDVLLTAGNLALIANDQKSYMASFSACAASFPNDPGAAWCHWRIAFQAYRDGSAGATDMFKTYLVRFPTTEHANSALYYLGRISEKAGDMPCARAYFDAVLDHYPNTYYAILARDHLKNAKVRAAEPNLPTLQFLRELKWPARPQAPSFVPDRDTQKRLARARLLHLALLDSWAELELRYGATTDGNQPYLYAYELAKVARDSGSTNRAIRYIKNYAPSYLLMGVEDAPLSFWQMAFPIPYRNPIYQYSRAQGLDPYLVSALIRQESEFNPQAISPANAYGLMQVLPSTGRQLARQLRIRRFSSRSLLTPERNIQLGTKYFRWLIDVCNGREECALAAFNAGKSRTDLWQTWGAFSEPAEFIETIPFAETRGYVQVVLRNADMYRRLYSSTPPGPPSASPAPRAAKSKTTHKRLAHPKR